MIVAYPSLLPSFPAPASHIPLPQVPVQPFPLADHLQSRAAMIRLTLDSSYCCSLFALFFRPLFFVFSHLQPLLPKKGGWGIPISARRTATLWTQIEGRLENVEARRNEPPDTARATKALVHSSPLRGLAATRGACSRRNQSRNIRPKPMEAGEASMPVAMERPATSMPVPVR